MWTFLSSNNKTRLRLRETVEREMVDVIHSITKSRYSIGSPHAEYVWSMRNKNALSLSAIIMYWSSDLQIPWTETTRKNVATGRHTWRILIAMRSSYQKTTISTGYSACNAWTSFALFLPFDLVAVSVPECLSIFLQVCWMVILFTASRKLSLGKSQWFVFNLNTDRKLFQVFTQWKTCTVDPIYII